jgi:menaquinone-dependent protoporphyrinogen oxidase
MKVLVVAASRHGGTQEIGEFITRELKELGVDAEMRDAREQLDLARYDGVVLGSAVYMGNWLADARVFYQENRASLEGIPLWLYSSGPIGEIDPKPHGEPPGIKDILDDGVALNHRVFTGRLEMKRLGLLERLIAKGVHVPEGDFRDWEDIRGWTHEIADRLLARQAAKR